VQGDGRVVRTEEGGDTVSEGQAYGLLLAAAIEDQQRFDQVWSWTRAHLQRDDGLLAWHWADGAVVSFLAATDADLDAARALALAARRFGDDAYRTAAEEMAEAILRLETTEHDGTPILTAGPWATQEDPVVLNPSYFSPRAYAELADLTGDSRWDDLMWSSRARTNEILGAEGVALPPNWAVLTHGSVTPSSAPAEGDAPAFYGLDAARVPVRYAASCEPEDHAVAARLWPPLSALREDRLRSHHYLGGQPSAEEGHPLNHVAAAAAAQAAGHEDQAAQLLDEAELVHRDAPSYYGAAWVALGRVKLQTDLLGPC
jgi:endoglucanase